jgi:hypothetical protein
MMMSVNSEDTAKQERGGGDGGGGATATSFTYVNRMTSPADNLGEHNTDPTVKRKESAPNAKN